MSEQSVELRLVDKGVEKFFRAELAGLELVTTTGKAGSAGRKTRKTLKSQDEAAKAFAKAVLAKKKAGFFPLAEGYGDPFDLEASGPVERVSKLKVRAVPHVRDRQPSPRNRPPIQLEKRRRELGWGYADGPGEWGLWSPGRLQVGKRLEIRDVEPELPGTLDYKTYPHLYQGFEFRPDGDGILLIRNADLVELDLPSARAEVRHTFPDERTAAAARPLYAGDSRTVLWLEGPSLVAKESGGEATPVFEAPGRIRGAARLYAGAIAVLTTGTCFILSADYAVTHRLAVRKGFALGTWLDGRILVVAMDLHDDPRTSVFFAVDDDGGLHELHQARRTVQAAFDLRGCQWLTEKNGAQFRVFNADLCYENALEKPAVAADHVINLAPLHDFIVEAHNAKPPVTQPVIAALEAVPARLETRAYNDLWTPLGYAAGWFGDVAIAKILLDAGAELDAFDRRGKTALASAFEKGHLEAANLLIERGARGSFDATTTVVEGEEVTIEPPIVAAARRGYIDQVKTLLDAGADVNATGHGGASALSAAMSGKHPQLAELLMERGARVGGLEAVKSAVDSGNVEVARKVIPGNEALRTGDSGKILRGALLSLSVSSIPREIVDLLIEAGAKDDTAEGLHRAIDARHPAAVRAILGAGVDANAPYVVANAPDLPLCRSFFNDNPDLDVAAALLDGGADVHAIDNRRLNAINYAAANVPAESVAWLLDRGASTERRGAVWTPLLQAVNKGRIDVMELLHERGADLDETCLDDDFGPLALAIQKQQREAADWLLAHDVDVNAGNYTPLMAAALANDVALIDRLLAAGADPTRKAANPFERDKTERTAQAHAEAKSKTEAASRLAEASGAGFTSLHPAVEADDLETVARMLDEGADIEAKGGRGGMRPLHAAATRSLAMVELLLARGGDPNATNDHGVTVLMSACQGRDDGAVDRVRALLEAGADPKVRVRNGTSALESAVSAGNIGVARLLLNAGAAVENKRKRIHQPVHLAAGNDDVEMLELLMTKKPRIEPITVDHNGGQRTPLHIAAERNAAAAAEWLLRHGADPATAGEWPNKDDYDEVYWNEGERNPIHVAAAAGSFEALVVLLRHDDRGAAYAETANHKYLADLAEDHPRCLALIEAYDQANDIDAALAMLRDAEGATARAEAGGELWIERITEEIGEGTNQAPAAVRNALGPHDWVRTLPIDGAASLVLRFDGGLYRVEVGDERGVLPLPVTIRSQRLPYAIDPEGRSFLVSDRKEVYRIDLPVGEAPSVREVASDLSGDVTEVGFLGAGASFVVAGGSFARYPASDGPVAASWRIDASDLREAFGTGSDTLGLVFHSDVLRVVWAQAQEDGLRLHGTFNDSIRFLWTRREGDGSISGYAYSSWRGPRVFRLHHLDGIAPSGAPVTELPGPATIAELPAVPVRAAGAG